MLEHVLVPLDGSDLAETALPFAAFLVRQKAGRISLVRAVESWHRGRASIDAPDNVQSAEKYLAGVKETLSGQQIEVACYVSQDEASCSIAGAAKSHGADTIVMATHGRSGVARLALGSVAERVVRSSGLPVLLIPPHCGRRWAPSHQSTVVVPLDGSPLAEEAIEPAKELATRLAATLTLIQVIEPPDPRFYAQAPVYPDFDIDQWVEEAKPYLQNLAKNLEQGGMKVHSETLAGYAAATIVSQALANDADAIVMASHGRTGLARAVMGSVANGIVHRADVPVLVIRPAALDVQA